MKHECAIQSVAHLKVVGVLRFPLKLPKSGAQCGDRFESRSPQFHLLPGPEPKIPTATPPPPPQNPKTHPPGVQVHPTKTSRPASPRTTTTDPGCSNVRKTYPGPPIATASSVSPRTVCAQAKGKRHAASISVDPLS